jgi:sugar/nucleoside kinase (ribokinase family)
MASKTYQYDIMGLGSPIMDTLVQVSEEFIQSIAGEKGGMEMVTAEEMADLLRQAGSEPTQAAGGSAGNTVFTLAQLGARTTFLGKIGSDPNGELYRKTFEELGGDASRFKVSETANACCLSLITPDSQRTMRTFLGASAELTPEEISVSDFEGVRHVHVEGYLLFNPDLIRRVLECARDAGCTVSLDMASFEVVNASRPILTELLRDYVDILFANEDEASAYFQEERPYEEMAGELASLCRIAAVKMGKEGAWIASEGQLHRIDPVVIDAPTDTTGAGDLWASGFLHGWLKGQPLDVCGQYGSVLGAEVVQVVGASIPEDRWPTITEKLNAET